MAAEYRFTQPEDAGLHILCDALTRLPEVMRILLLLNVYDGLRTMEIAMMMDCDIRVVRALRERALRALEKQLAAKQLAIERDSLLLAIRKAYARQIQEQEPDPDSVARIRNYIAQLAAG